MLFCLQCSGDLENCSEDEIRTFLRLKPSLLRETKELFVKKGFIGDSWSILNWEKRQYTVEYKQQERHREKRAELGLPRRRWINPRVRERVMERDGKFCVYCTSKDNLTLDHIIPETKGGDCTESNLVVSCRACNARKRGFTIGQAGMSYRENYTPPNGSALLDNNKQTPSKPLASTDTDTDTDTEDKSISSPSPQSGEGPVPENEDSELLERYTQEERSQIEEAFRCIATTRRTGKLAESIKRAELKYWDTFEKWKVLTGITTYLDKALHTYGKRENYLRGIIRNASQNEIKVPYRKPESADPYSKVKEL